MQSEGLNDFLPGEFSLGIFFWRRTKRVFGRTKRLLKKLRTKRVFENLRTKRVFLQRRTNGLFSQRRTKRLFPWAHVSRVLFHRPGVMFHSRCFTAMFHNECFTSPRHVSRHMFHDIGSVVPGVHRQKNGLFCWSFCGQLAKVFKDQFCFSYHGQACAQVFKFIE